MNKTFYLDLSLLEISKIVMYEFWNDSVKLKYEGKGKFCYMATDSFIVYIKVEDVQADIEKDAKTRSDTLNYELYRPLPKGKNKNVIGLMKEKLSGKTMTEFTPLIQTTYIYLTDDHKENKKAKGTKKCVIKRKPKFEDFKQCLEATPLENKINQLGKIQLMWIILLNQH